MAHKPLKDITKLIREKEKAKDKRKEGPFMRAFRDIFSKKRR